MEMNESTADRDFRESERRLIQKELFRLEDQKDAAEQRFRAMFENALVGLFRGDVAARALTDANLEAALIFGLQSAEELIWWVNTETESFSFIRDIPDASQLDPGVPYSFSTRTKRRDGCEFWAQFSVRYTGEGRWLEGAVKDITDQVESLDRLRQAKAEAEDANEAKSRFLATMSHEIRTPLNGIIGFAEILQELDDPKSRVYSRKILDESERLMLLINQLLDFSKLEADKISLEAILLDLQQLLDEIDASMVERFEHSGLEYIRELEENVPRWLIGDPMRLRQVLTNLLSNALKFTRKGRVTVHIGVAGYTEDAALLRFSVNDTGIGIPPEKQEAIFSSFVQADSSISRRYGGTGLGISICCELVKLMGGKLELISEEGKGSEFYFTIPMALPSDTVDAVPIYRDGTLSKIESLVGRKTLIVEDYETNRDIARHHLEKAGCSVILASDGIEALEYLKDSKEDVDLIFMDMHMPRMDGLEATRQIRSLGIDTPIIGMTASAYAEDRVRCLDAGMDDFLTKPLRRGGLLTKAVDWVVSGGLNLIFRNVGSEPQGDLTGSRTLRYNDFLEELDGEKDLARELLDGFLEDSKTRLDHARRALESGSYSCLHRDVHSIKGGALNVMAEELAARAFEAEIRAREEIPYREMNEVLSALDEAFNRFAETWKGIRETDEAREGQPGSL